MSENEIAEIEETETTEETSSAPEAEFVDSFQMFSVIESLLFVSDKPVTVATMKSAFHGTNIDTKTIRKALVEMQSHYADPTRGVSLEEVNGGWQLRTKLDNFPYLKKINKTRPFRLSGPALEVLAIIAYKQPLIKNEVDQIRGVESGHLVRALMDKGLVCFQGKSELPGKPMTYGTTRKFLEIFGLRNLNELPTLEEIDQLLPDGIGEEDEKETLSDVTEMLSEQFEGNYSAGEEELLDITEKLGTIDTSSEFFEEEKRRQREKRDRDRAQDIREALEVGEEVATKDAKWLERYDAKQALKEEAVAVEEVAEVSEEETASAEEPLEAAATEEPIEVSTESNVEEVQEEVVIVATDESPKEEAVIIDKEEVEENKIKNLVIEAIDLDDFND